MKKITGAFLCLCLLTSNFSIGQLANVAVDSIEINTLKAKVFSDGRLVEVQTLDSGVYKSLLYTEAMWIAGLDGGNNIHKSTMEYRQGQPDFYPGPISNDPLAFEKYNKVYRVNLQTLTDFKNGMTVGIPKEIANWPAHGDTTMGEAYYLAPFVDVNQDGKYDPANGDYPKIKGDEAIYTIFNDAIFRTGGLEMGIEVHAMVYGYKTGGLEDSILFKEYRIINHSDSSYKDTYFSIFADFDLGNSRDDLMATNISANSIVTYNGDSDDEGPNGFGTRLATAGIRMIQGPYADYFDGIDNDRDGCVDAVRDANGNCIPENPATGVREQILLSGSMYYNNAAGVQGNPNAANDYYNYMKSLWKNGNNLLLENPSGLLSFANGDGYRADNVGTVMKFAYPGNDVDTTGTYGPISPVNWFESPANLNDKRSLANAGPFTMAKGQELNLTYAFIWSRKQDTAHGYNVINTKLTHLDTVYRNQPPRYVSVPTYYPGSNYRLAFSQYDETWWILNEDKAPLELKLFNISGQLLQSFKVEAKSSQVVDLEKLSTGVYLIVNEKSGTSHKIVK